MGNEASQAGTKKGDRLLAPALLVLLILILGIWANPLVTVARETAVWLGDTGIYLGAVLK
ncbi:MAG: hypothetical protein ACK2UV_15885, partial [Candidatus Promineifilaceae bacterium]